VRADRLSAQKELACLRAYSSVQPPPPAFFVTILSDIWIIPSFVSSNFLTEAYMDSRLADIFWVGSAWHAASSSVMQPTAGLPPGSSDMPSLLSAFGQAMSGILNSEALDYVRKPTEEFVKDSWRLVKRCTKPDRTEFTKVAQATSIGFAIMGFIGFFVKLIFIPINNIIVGMA